jgi:hypothetical protein
MVCMGRKEVALAHLFVRMGRKSVRLLEELADGYLADRSFPYDADEERRLERRIYPDETWFEAFPGVAAGKIPPEKITHELKRIREKCEDFRAHLARAGLTLAKVVAAVEKFHALFLEPGGEFAWYFERMVLAHRAGSLLFVHAGVDDEVAAGIRQRGVEGLNAEFRRMLAERDVFDLYHGPIGNVFRTKYRPTDLPLTGRGVADLHRAGLYAIVHGHRNIPHGQRIVFRERMLNFECDASIDRNTRKLIGIPGLGAAATVFDRRGIALGISTDHPTIKVFDPADACRLVTFA